MSQPQTRYEKSRRLPDTGGRFQKSSCMHEERMGFSVDVTRGGESEESFTFLNALKKAALAVRKRDNPIVEVGCLLLSSREAQLLGIERELLGLVVARSTLGEMYGLASETLERTPAEHVPGTLQIMIDCIGSVRRYAGGDWSREIIDGWVEKKVGMLQGQFGQ